jgi:hypothetical protein
MGTVSRPVELSRLTPMLQMPPLSKASPVAAAIVMVVGTVRSSRASIWSRARFELRRALRGASALRNIRRAISVSDMMSVLPTYQDVRLVTAPPYHAFRETAVVVVWGYARVPR